MPFARHDTVEVFYETFGDPSDPTLLLVNGLGSQCISYDVEFCELFVERGYFVIRFDNRDVGLSTKFDHAEVSVKAVIEAVRGGQGADVPYRLSDMANDAIAVLDDLGVDRAHVVGMSMGGMIVQQLAIDHATRLHSMTSIMSTTGDPDVGHPSAEVAVLFYGPAANERDEVVRSRVELDRLCASPAFFDAERVARRTAEAFDRCFNPKGVARQMAGVIASGSRSGALRDVLVPALVIHGDADTLIDISGGERTAQCIDGSTFVAIEGMGHDAPPELWSRWVQLIDEHARCSTSH